MNIRAGYLNKNTATATAIMSIFKCVLISNKYLKNKVNRTTKAQLLHSSYHHKIASFSNSKWQKRKDRPSRFTNNGDMAESDNVTE